MRCLSTGGIVYHVLNRRVGRLELFEKPTDYLAFGKILAEACYKNGLNFYTARRRVSLS
jgi:hypothetical protein